MRNRLHLLRRKNRLVPGAAAIYLFTEGAGTTLRDFSGNANDGTLGAGAAAPTWTPRGLSFDGGDIVTCGLPNRLYAGADTPFAVTAVFTAPASEATIRIIVARSSASWANATFAVYTYNGDCRVKLRGSEYYLGPDLAPGTTHIITITWDGTTAKYYLDAAAPVVLTVGTSAEQTTEGVTIGAINAAAPDGFWSSDINAVAIYPFAPTGAQVAQNGAALNALLSQRRGVAVPFDTGGSGSSNGLPLAIHIQFDDGYSSVYENAFPILSAAGLTATAAIISSKVGTAYHMTEAQILELYEAGWDIANHTATHVDLNTLTLEEQEAEFAACAAYLDGLGMTRASHNVTPPHGEAYWNGDTYTALAATGMRTMQRSRTTRQTVPFPDLYNIDGYRALFNGVTVDFMKQYITASGPSEILFIGGHYVDNIPGPTSWPPEYLAELVAYIKAMGIRVVTISQLWDYVQAGYEWP